MIVNVIEGYTHIIGRDQGYGGLPIRGEVIDVNGGVLEVMASSWTPTPRELRTLLQGGSIVLRVGGTMHPPVSMNVEPPSDI